MSLTASSDFSVTVDGQTLPVRVQRHARARGMRLRFDAARGELRLTLPPRARLAPAQSWVADQHLWIRRQLATTPTGEIVTHGTALPWGGGQLRIDWRKDAARLPVLSEGLLIVGGPQEAIGPRVGRWLVARARDHFTQSSVAMAGGEGLRLAGVAVGDPRSRWGSCTAAGQIRYSWRLIMAPDFVQQAIVAHEVAHLAHMNHGPGFHALVRDLAGDAHDQSRRWLRAHGRDLHRWRFVALTDQPV